MLFGLFSALSLPSVLSAQSFLTGQDITINQSSNYPAPGSSLTLNASSNSFNINKSEVSWYLNGTLDQTGPGLNSYTFNVGQPGTETRVSVVVTTDKNVTVKKDLVYRPASVDLVYEATSSYSHPFYKGKKIATHLSPVKVVAFANFVDRNGKRYSPNEIIYKWTVNDSVNSSASGVGKSQMTFAGPTYHKSAKVRVDAETVDGKFIQARQISIKAQDPKIVFYEDHPTLGLLDQKAYYGNDFNLIDEEVALRVVPYGMTNLDNFREVEYKWTLNGKALLPTGDRNKIILRNEGLDGKAVLNLNIYNNKKILQFAKSSLGINFGTAAFENIIRTGESFGPGRSSGYFEEDKETFFGPQ